MGSTAREPVMGVLDAGIRNWKRTRAAGSARPAPGQRPDRARDSARGRIRRPAIEKKKTMKTLFLTAGASYSAAGSVPGSVRALSGRWPGAGRALAWAALPTTETDAGQAVLYGDSFVRFRTFFTAILLFVFGVFSRRFFSSFSEHFDHYFPRVSTADNFLHGGVRWDTMGITKKKLLQ